MPAAQLPDNESERHAALVALNILDTPRTRDFDVFPEMATQIFSAPIGAISLIDTDRQWLKASIGFAEDQTPRSQSFCAHAILRPQDVLYVPDARRDLRFADNPLVTGSAGFRAYAGAPILGPSGHAIGVLCVLDRTPRQFSGELLGRLSILAGGVAGAIAQFGALQALRRKEADRGVMQAMLSSVFQKVDAPVLIMRSSGTALIGNAAYQALSGYRAEELPFLSLQQLLGADYQSEDVAAHEREGGGREPHRMQSVLVHKDGSAIPVQVTSAMVARPDSQFFRVVTVTPLQTRAEVKKRAKPVGVSGCIQFFGLEPIKAAYGPRWPAMRTSLLLQAENILKRRICEEDVYSRTDDDGFSIWFKRGTEEENAARMSRIRREIQVMLLGELGEETNCSVGAYTQVMEAADPATPPAVIMEGLTQRLAERRREAEAQARALIEQVLRDQPCEHTPIHNKTGAMSASFADLPATLRARFAGAMSLIHGPSAEIDGELLRFGLAVQAVLDDVAEGRERIHFLEVSAAIFLSRRGRERFLGEWRSLQPSICARLFVMLSDVSKETSLARLGEIAVMLQQSKGVGLMIDRIDALPANAQCRPFAMIGLCAEAFAALPDEKLRGMILRLHQDKMRVLVRLKKGESPKRWLGAGADLTSTA